MALQAPIDSRVHHIVIEHIIECGHAPSVGELARTLRQPEEAIQDSLRRLADNHGLVLHPGTYDIWIAHPFSLSPTAVWLRAGDRGWWTPCLWCALGAATLIESDAVIHTRMGGECEVVEIRVQDGTLSDQDLLVHFMLPPRDAWNNVIHYCATVLPFPSEAAIDAWCARHCLPRGVAVPLPRLHRLACRWYGQHRREDWVKWNGAQARAIFEQAGLTGPFWALEATDSRF